MLITDSLTEPGPCQGVRAARLFQNKLTPFFYTIRDDPPWYMFFNTYFMYRLNKLV